MSNRVHPLPVYRIRKLEWRPATAETDRLLLTTADDFGVSTGSGYYGIWDNAEAIKGSSDAYILKFVTCDSMSGSEGNVANEMGRYGTVKEAKQAAQNHLERSVLRFLILV